MLLELCCSTAPPHQQKAHSLLRMPLPLPLTISDGDHQIVADMLDNVRVLRRNGGATDRQSEQPRRRIVPVVLRAQLSRRAKVRRDHRAVLGHVRPVLLDAERLERRVVGIKRLDGRLLEKVGHVEELVATLVRLLR